MRKTACVTFACVAIFAVAAAAQTVQTVAGGGLLAGTNYTSSIALSNPQAIVADSSGTNAYLAIAGAKNTPQQSVVLKVTGTSPNLVVTVYAGSNLAGYSGDLSKTDLGTATAAQLNLTQVNGMAVDAAGDLFIPDNGNCVIREVTAAGIISTVVGDGTCGYAGDGGLAIAAGTAASGTTAAVPGAELNNPTAVAVDGSGNLYISDTGNNVIREVTASTGNISTIAGIAGTTATAAAVISAATAKPPTAVAASKTAIGSPAGIALDASGNLYVADTADAVIWEITNPAAATNPGVLTVVAGTGTLGDSADGAVTTTAITPDGAIALDTAGDVFFTDGFSVRKAAAGAVTTVTGNPCQPLNGTNTKCTGTGLYLGPSGLQVNSSGTNVTVADAPAFAVFNPSATPTMVAGNGLASTSGDGGAAVGSQMAPSSVAIDASGNLIVSDSNELRSVVLGATTSANTIAALAGNGTAGYTGDGAAATAATVAAPAGAAVDAAGDIFFADSGNNVLREISATTHNIFTVAGNGAACGKTNNCYNNRGDDGPALEAELNDPTSVAVDGSGNIFFRDAGSYIIREITAKDGIIHTIAGNGTEGTEGDSQSALSAEIGADGQIALDSSGNVYFADQDSGEVREISNGTVNAVNGATGIGTPTGLAMDASGNTFITGSSKAGDQVYELAGGTLTALTGSGKAVTALFANGSAANDVAFCAVPGGLATDGMGNVYVSDGCAGAIREIQTVANATLSPKALSFPAQVQKTASISQIVTVTNNGGVALTVSTIAFDSKTTSADFKETDTCTSATKGIAPGANCLITVTFTPSTTADESQNLVITDNAPDSPQSVAITAGGSATGISISPATVNFGNVAPSASGTAQTMTVTNTSAAAVPVAIIFDAAGKNNADFTNTGATCVSVPAATATANGACTFSVNYAPAATAAGAETATVDVNSTATTPVLLASAALSGTAGAPAVTYTVLGSDGKTQVAAAAAPAAALTFAGQIVGAPSASQTITVDNSKGTAAFLLATKNAIVASGGITGSNYTASTTCGSSVAAGKTCTISVTFTPSTTGTITGAVIVTDVKGNATTLDFTGTGEDVQIVPAAASGSTLAGSTSATVTPGQAATYSLSVGQTGFAGSVALSCSVTNQSSNITCAVSPSSMTFASGGAAQALTVTATTVAAVHGAVPGFGWFNGKFLFWGGLGALALLAMLMLFSDLRRQARRWAVFGMMGAAVVVMAGCGVAATPVNPNQSTTTASPTPAGQYTILVKAAATNSGAKSSAGTTTATLTLNVN